MDHHITQQQRESAANAWRQAATQQQVANPQAIESIAQQILSGERDTHLRQCYRRQQEAGPGQSTTFETPFGPMSMPPLPMQFQSQNVPQMPMMQAQMCSAPAMPSIQFPTMPMSQMPPLPSMPPLGVDFQPPGPRQTPGSGVFGNTHEYALSGSNGTTQFHYSSTSTSFTNDHAGLSTQLPTFQHQTMQALPELFAPPTLGHHEGARLEHAPPIRAQAAPQQNPYQIPTIMSQTQPGPAPFSAPQNQRMGAALQQQRQQQQQSRGNYFSNPPGQATPAHPPTYPGQQQR